MHDGEPFEVVFRMLVERMFFGGAPGAVVFAAHRAFPTRSRVEVPLKMPLHVTFEGETMLANRTLPLPLASMRERVRIERCSCSEAAVAEATEERLLSRVRFLVPRQ